MHVSASWFFLSAHFSRQRSLFINLLAMVLSHPGDELEKPYFRLREIWFPGLTWFFVNHSVESF